MYGSFYLAGIETASGFGFRIVGAVNHGHIAVRILFKTGAGNEISIHQAYFIAGEQTEIFSGRLFHKVFPFNIEFPSERYLTASQFLIFQVVGRLQHLDLSFGIVVNHQLNGIDNRHHPGSLQLQILSDTVFQHCIIHRGIALGNTAEIHKHLNGFRRKASSSKGCHRYQTGIIPAVHNTFFHQPLNITLSGYHIGKIHFGKLYLLGRTGIFQFPHHPVV